MGSGWEVVGRWWEVGEVVGEVGRWWLGWVRGRW